MITWIQDSSQVVVYNNPNQLLDYMQRNRDSYFFGAHDQNLFYYPTCKSLFHFLAQLFRYSLQLFFSKTIFWFSV